MEYTTMLATYEQLKSLVAAVEDDLKKAVGGNRTAGTRVRKQMQDIKSKAQELRVKVLGNRPADGVPTASSPAEPPTT